jgi:hypothetical protein
VTATLEDLSQETIDQIVNFKKAASEAGIYADSGIYGYDLSELVSLIPVVTPWRDRVYRGKPKQASPFATWRAIMNVTNTQPSPAPGFDFAGNEVQVQEQDFQARYKPIAYSGNVTQDAYDLAEGYADPYAVETFNVMNQLLIGEDRQQMCAQSFPLAAAVAPTLTQQGTGGTITTGTFYVGVAGRTGTGYFYGNGNSKGASNSTTFASGSSNSILATTTALRGAVCYDWFFSSDGVTFWYYTTTTINSVTITHTISSNNALPATLPDLSQLWQGPIGVPTYNSTADNGSGFANDYDGLLASLSGDYNGTGQWVQAGTGASSGGAANPSVWTSLNGAALTLNGGTIAEIQQYIFMALWNQVKASPTAIMVNALQAQEMANLILGTNSATTFLNTDSSGRINVTAGGRVGHIVNAPAGGVEVPIEVHVSLPPSTIIGRMDRVPFPQANISSVFEQRCLRDMAQFDYGIARIAGVKGGGPRKEFEIRTNSAFVNRAPVAQAVISNVA